MTVVARCALVFGVLPVRLNGLAFESSCHRKNRRARRAPREVLSADYADERRLRKWAVFIFVHLRNLRIGSHPRGDRARCGHAQTFAGMEFVAGVELV